MFPQLRRVLLLTSVLAVVSLAAVAITAPSASAYGKANWQTTLVGTFNFPATGVGFGFWGWCDFAGGVRSGNDADCQLAEYMHFPAGTGWTCELSIQATSWDQSPSFFGGNTFHVWGSAIVHPANLRPDQKAACVSFFTGGDGSTTFADVDTFIPAAPGHYNIGPKVIDSGAVGAFNFTVKQIP
jgi:hypothetical protein